MKIMHKAIHVIDYENKTVQERSTPDSFNDYVTDLVTHIKSNENVRNYKTNSNSTEVINCSREILRNIENYDYVNEKMNIIAQRLLRTEINAQSKIERMQIRVKKGSLIQALLYDENIASYFFLLAKVEHGDFVDDLDYSFKTGFSKDKKTIWKSCLIDLFEPDAQFFLAKVYSDTKAKYWSVDFLELNELVNDETNTFNAFKAIDETLNRTLKNLSRDDYTYIRNTFIAYFRGHEHIDYSTMISEIMDNYQPANVDIQRFSIIKSKLSDLPEKRKFDYQFNSVPSAIAAKIRKTYKVNDGIELKITSDIPNIKETIKSIQDIDGSRYLQIKTNNEDTFACFR